MSDWDDSSLDGYFEEPPRQGCRTFSDGTPERPSALCWAWLVIMVLAFLSNACATIAYGSGLQGDARLRYVLVGGLSLAVGALNIWIFYHFLKQCECWTGFAVTVVVALLAAIVFAWLLAPAQQSLQQQAKDQFEAIWQQIKAQWEKEQK